MEFNNCLSNEDDQFGPTFPLFTLPFRSYEEEKNLDPNCWLQDVGGELQFPFTLISGKPISLLQGVPQNSGHFVLGDFSPSLGATLKILDIFHQPA